MVNNTQLSAMYYNSIITSLNLNKETFQLCQATSPIPYTSQSVWEIFDMIPPKSLYNNFEFSEHQKFSENYFNVLNNLVIPENDQLKTALRDQYDDWIEYQKSNYSAKVGVNKEFKDMDAFFDDWLNCNVNFDKHQRAMQAFLSYKNNQLIQALRNSTDPQYRDNKNRVKYSKNIDDISGSILHGKSYTFDLDSRNASNETSTTWAKGDLGIIFNTFFYSPKGDYSKESSTFTSESVNIKGKFDSVAITAATEDKWYNSGVLSNAYHTKDNTVWGTGTPNWETTFGDDGSIKRRVNSVVYADGFELTVSSTSIFNYEQQQKIRNNHDFHIFPFISVSVDSQTQTNVSFDKDGRLTITSKLAKGNPFLLGVNVSPIESTL